MEQADNIEDVLVAALKVVKGFGFDYAEWRTQLPLPINRNKIMAFSTPQDKVFDKVLKGDYDEYLGVKHCSRSIELFYYLGNTYDDTFLKQSALWEEYYSLGRYGGWAQSLIERKTMFSLFWVDTSAPIIQQDIGNIYYEMQWVSMAVLSRLEQVKRSSDIVLLPYEKEGLRWIGDGKTIDKSLNCCL